MGHLAQAESDYHMIIRDFKMRVGAKGRKPKLFTRFINEVQDLDDKERCLQFFVDNPTFIDEFKQNIASNVRRQIWVEKKSKLAIHGAGAEAESKAGEKNNEKKRKHGLTVDEARKEKKEKKEELIDKKKAIESELRAIEAVLQSL